MYDELIELMRYCANDNPVCEKSEACPFYNQAEEDYGYYFCVERMMKQAADAIEELQKQLREEKVDNVNLTGWLAEEHAKHRWIPVTERLPENGVPVLLSCKCGAGAYVCDGFHTEKYSMPIPFYEDIDADYDEEADEYYFPEGWWEVIKNWDDYSCVAIEDTVTHWMPLPQPPEDGES